MVADPGSGFATPPDETAEARVNAKADAGFAAGHILVRDAVGEWLLKLANGPRINPLSTQPRNGFDRPVEHG